MYYIFSSVEVGISTSSGVDRENSYLTKHVISKNECYGIYNGEKCEARRVIKET